MTMPLTNQQGRASIHIDPSFLCAFVFGLLGITLSLALLLAYPEAFAALVN
jgi:hypothetical protein